MQKYAYISAVVGMIAGFGISVAAAQAMDPVQPLPIPKFPTTVTSSVELNGNVDPSQIAVPVNPDTKEPMPPEPLSNDGYHNPAYASQ